MIGEIPPSEIRPKTAAEALDMGAEAVGVHIANITASVEKLREQQQIGEKNMADLKAEQARITALAAQASGDTKRVLEEQLRKVSDLLALTHASLARLQGHLDGANTILEEARRMKTELEEARKKASS